MPLEICDTDYEKAEYQLAKAGVTGPTLRYVVAEAIAMERQETRRACEQIRASHEEAT